MTPLTVYDPPQCCSTGVCGADVDQNLVTFAADLDWLRSRGVKVRRINLSQEPMEFVSEPIIKSLMDASGSDGLPAIVAAGHLVSKAHYPSRSELAELAGVEVRKAEISSQTRELIALGAAIATNSQPSLKRHITTARDAGASEDAIREAIAIGRNVRVACAAKIDADTDTLIAASGQSCCVGTAKSDESKENQDQEIAGSCC